MDAADSVSPWSRADSARASLWFVAALLARGPLVARIEGVLDHDQSVVGLMALDIASGRRLPIFFDGQRYMGAVEAYVAAGFVGLFGHSPSVVALAPLLAFGLFAAGQFVAWRLWRDRATGNLAALLTVTGAPMFALWSIVPRGGYIEFLAWALPTLAIYHALTAARPSLSPLKQAAWGFLLAIGYFLNPLSLTVYATLALDWLFVRHGADLRAERLPRAPWIWGLFALAFLNLLAFLCHVDPTRADGGLPYIVFGGYIEGPVALALAATGVVGMLSGVAWWSNAGPRVLASLRARPWAILGLMLALLPSLLHGVLARVGLIDDSPSLPMWISAPWNASANLGRGVRVLGCLVGCDPQSIETVLLGQGVDAPAHHWSGLARLLTLASPMAVGIVAMIVLIARARASLDAGAPFPPLAKGGLGGGDGWVLDADVEHQNAEPNDGAGTTPPYPPFARGGNWSAGIGGNGRLVHTRLCNSPARQAIAESSPTHVHVSLRRRRALPAASNEPQRFRRALLGPGLGRVAGLAGVRISGATPPGIDGPRDVPDRGLGRGAGVPLGRHGSGSLRATVDGRADAPGNPRDCRADARRANRREPEPRRDRRAGIPGDLAATRPALCVALPRRRPVYVRRR